jgi:major membrane immunogen (membrane-anchored lipoprotein)
MRSLFERSWIFFTNLVESHNSLSGSSNIVGLMKQTHLRRRSLLAVPLAASFVFAACGSSDSTANDSTAATATEAAESTGDVSESTDAETPTTDGAESADTVATDAQDAASASLGSYSLMDEEFGTMTTVTVDGATRVIESNALPDHETGEFPNDGNPNTISEQDASYEYPTEPTFVGDATFAMTPGVAVNGVKFEPATAESVTCASGESYRVEALQDVYNLGFDFNNAHVQPTGEYHYHGVSELLADAYATDDDLVHVGFAADGYLMYYSKSGAYEPGYELSTDTRSGTDCTGSGALGGVDVEVDGTTPDGTYTSDWVSSDDNGDLDECNGIEIDGEYAYLITDEYPYVGRCLNGEFTATGPGAGGPPPDGLAGTRTRARHDGH